MDLNRIHPKFVRWLDAQSDSIKAEVDGYWDVTATHGDIAHGDKSGVYARQHRTLAWCAARFGYDHAA